MSKKLHQTLGDWRSTATNVKARIYAETIEGKKPKKRYPTFIKITAAAAVLTVGITGAILFTNDPTPAPTPAVENNLEQMEEQVAAFRPINETFLKIAQYELFYRDYITYTQESAVAMALYNGINYYALFNHLADHNYYWDEEKRKIQRNNLESALDTNLKDPHFAAYFEKMLAELSITKDQYIDDYLLVEKEFEMLKSEMFHKGVGLKDGSYETSTVEDEFRKKMGLSFDYVEYLGIIGEDRLTPLDPQPNLGFNQIPDHYGSKVTKNLTGEYIFVDPEISRMDLPPDIGDYLYELVFSKNQITELTRFSFPQIKAAVTDDAAKGNAMAQQTLNYFTILERSIEWELDVQPYVFNEIPTFDSEGLRIHNDLTLKIAEYELYHKDESIHEWWIAYRYANELVANMYGLFNYLAQDHGYGWSAEIRAQYTASLKQELEASMQNELEKNYMEKLLAEFNITLDDYIKYYALPKKEYEVLQQNMLKDKVGVDKNGRYNPGKQSSRYREAVGLTWKNMFDTMEAKSITPRTKTLDTQPDLPFALNSKFPITVVLNNDGEYVLEYPSFVVFCLTDEQKALYEEIQAKHNLPPLARYSVQAYIMQVQPLSTVTAKELVEIFTLLDRTIN